MSLQVRSFIGTILWFVAFWSGAICVWFSYGHDAPHFYLFLIGMFITSVGSCFVGHFLTKDE